MKKTALALLSFLFLAIFACNYSKGVKKDLATGLTATYNGFAVEDIYLADTDGNHLGSNTITLGSKISILATGVDFFTAKESKVFPGCRIILTDKNKKEILNLPDAFSDMVNGTTAAEAKVLKASLNTGDPMVVGETYHLAVRFFDKNNNKNEIVADADLLMK